MLGVNQDTAIKSLLTLGVISKQNCRRGYYRVMDVPEGIFPRLEVVRRFLIEIEPWRYILNKPAIDSALGSIPAELKRLSRSHYHSAPRNYDEAIQRVEINENDGVRRTFGLEYEIYALNSVQEDKLVRLLETFSSDIEFVTEHDGSLGSNGVELVFMPLSEDNYIEVVKKLNAFVKDNSVTMQSSQGMAGMHTTYGVNNSQCSRIDLQIRLNRIALAIKSMALKTDIVKVFGRDFGNYRMLPSSTTEMTHSNAFSCQGRSSNCWECRLPDYKADPELLVKFLKLTEFVFRRPIERRDFNAIFDMFISSEEDYDADNE